MRRSVQLVQQALSLQTGALDVAPAAVNAARQFSSAPVFASLTDAPLPTGGKIKIDLAPGANGAVSVNVAAGAAKASTSLAPAAVRAAQDSATQLVDVARISVLHSSLQEHLLRLLQQRFAILAEYPDFSQYFGKDVYYRAHPDTIREFYNLVDEYHRMYDTATEFESLSHLAMDLVPAYRKRLLNPVHPAITPSTASATVASFLLSQAK